MIDPIFLPNLDGGKRAGQRKRSAAKSARRSRDSARAHKPPYIVAWDGEGLSVEDGTPQPYVYMANSEGESLTNIDGLKTVDILHFIVDSAAKRKGAKHFIFGGTYDANQWLADVPEKSLRKLWTEGKCVYAGYFIQYRPRKQFYIKRFSDKKSVTIWDAFPWFQSSFVAAIAKYLGSDYPDYDLIARMKAQRSQFSLDDLPAIEEYTQAELRALVRLVEYMISQLWSGGIYPSRYDGPGAAAAYLLKQNGIQAHRAPTPPAIRYAAAVAYSGGRIEVMQYGSHRNKPVYHYDLHSAYPAAMRELPSFAGGRWSHHSDGNAGRWSADGHSFSLMRIRWSERLSKRSTSARFYPFPFRVENGSIYYPHAGESWIWSPEYAAYLDNAQHFNLDCEVIERYDFHPLDISSKPFAWVESLYDLRAQWKREGNGAEYGLKLGLNSLYGKLAQTVGWNGDKMPPFYQIEWAGLITSMTRAALLRAACTDSDAIIMFATDGIFSTRPLPLELGEKLGQWGEEIHDGISVVQSGVYFLFDGSDVRAYTRGYTFERVTPTETNADRDRRYALLVNSEWRAGTRRIPLKQSRFHTLGSALAGNQLSGKWRSWTTDDRYLDLRPTGKRQSGKSTANPASRLVRSFPASIAESYVTGTLSAPYDRAWRENLEEIDGTRMDIYEEEIEDANV